MRHYEIKDLPVPDLHKLLLGGIGPRPIALVSTVSEDGINNLSPFSFFNAFGANPPMIAFSPARRGRDATLKDTYHNLIVTKECVVQSVTYSMVEQINLASTEYPPGVDEFVKSGLTPIDSDIVKPKRVKESPFQMECKLIEMKSYGEKGGSANMAICEVLKLHIAEDIFTNGVIDPQKIDLVGRMSGSYYCRAVGDAIFELSKPASKNCIGFDNLPDFIKTSHIFSANNLGKLANVDAIPDDGTVTKFLEEIKDKHLENFESGIEAFYRYKRLGNYKYMLKAAVELREQNYTDSRLLFELTAKCALENNDVQFAWLTVLSVNKLG